MIDDTRIISRLFRAISRGAAGERERGFQISSETGWNRMTGEWAETKKNEDERGRRERSAENFYET